VSDSCAPRHRTRLDRARPDGRRASHSSARWRASSRSSRRAAAATASSSQPGATSGGARGGVCRVGWENSFGFTDNLDPTGEYLGEAFGIFSNLLVRTLVGYDHVAGAAGNKLVPDLATSVPKLTNGGKTYTFHLKPGIKFGPPVNRELTSHDVAYALERIAKPKNGAQYGFHYDVIKGFTDYGSGKAASIAGVKTPNPKTIAITLTKPTCDFLYRMAMPASGPIPEQVTKCFDGQPGKYGLDLVSSGPYMLQGAGSVNASSCKTIKPMSGFWQTRLAVVRNPSYDPKTDSTSAHQSLPDEFVWTIDSSADDILGKVSAGQLDDEVSTIPTPVLRQYSTDSSLKPHLHLDSGDRTWYLRMNLTQPPFDDVHTRKAMNWVMDKAALVQAWGGPTSGQVADHVVPNTLFSNQLGEYAPYATAGDHGSVAKAKAALRGSRYDTRNNGTCSASACKHVLLVADVREVDKKMLPVIEQSAAQIGITFDVRSVNGAYPAIQAPRNNIPIAERTGWGKDYADALTFFDPLFDGRNIIPQGNSNYSLVGLTPQRAKQLGVKGDVKNVPNIDSSLDGCSPLGGQQRLSCYEQLDRTVMTKVVPWVPYLWSYAQHVTGPKVTQWAFDQFGSSIGYAQVAVR
jgi:peptide/nickel transport system substrate-binding protein